MFSRMKTGTKILASYAIAIALLSGLGIFSYLSLGQVVGLTSLIADARYPSAAAVADIYEAQTDVQRVLNALNIRKFDSAARTDLFAQLEEAYKHINEGVKAWEALPHTDKGNEQWKASWALLERWRKDTEAAADIQKDRSRLLESGAGHEDPRVVALDDRAHEALKRVRESYKPSAAAIKLTYKYVDEVVAQEGRHGEAVGARATALLIAVILASAAALTLLGVFLARSTGKAIRDAAAEASRLTTAVAEGKLDVRGDAEKVHFEFRPIVDGMNRTMDAFAKPLAQSRDYMERISKGDIPTLIGDDYKGDFDLTKRALNRCIEALKALVNDGRSLAEGAATGKLSTRADASLHLGDFRKIVEGFNGTLDAVVKPIEEATQVLERLAQRDLRARVKGSYKGDHAKITDALNATAEALHDAMAQVAQGVDQVSSASAQIASSSQAVASGASEQASSLEETGSSLESMSSMTKQAADNAQQASMLATAAKSAATEGSAAMEQMTGAMVKIKASAEGTSQIIKDINEIAFQTNLLALNAAVEAARAGEAGRGFAVVAEEVRSLALRSKEAANKTEELIRQSVREAGEGEVSAKHVNGKLSEIVVSVSKVTDIVAEISATAKEQASGIEQVNKAMGQMNTVTQQNAASSEESSSAAAELSGQSEELAAMVGLFQLDGVAVTRKPAGAQAFSTPVKKPLGARKNGHNGAVRRPDQLIPMGDAPAFKDF